MTSYRLAALFLALALPFLSPGSATAGFREGADALARGDYQDALRELVPLAHAGNSWAQVMLGMMYASGQGVPQNDAEAAKWYYQAATQGLAIAQSAIGQLYMVGWGVPRNYGEAVKWFRLSAEQGDAVGQFNLGVAYSSGQGVPQVYAEAARWYRLAAEQGNAKAQVNLAVMYDRGRGVPQDYAEAVRWFRMAADQGYANAQTSLGAMYARGRGVPQNWLLAYMWLNLGIARLEPGQLRETSAKLRNIAAEILTPSQLAQAQEKAQTLQPKVAARSKARATVDFSDLGTAVDRGAGANEPPSSPGERTALGEVRVLTVQQRLTELGYYPGPADGIFGSRTRTAVRAFQVDAGLPVDGQVSDRLIAALSNAGADGASAPARMASAEPGGEGAGATPWDYAKERRLEGTGTGFAVSEGGQIVTNHHVVADCAEVHVRPAGQDAMAGAVVARDAGNDLALLKAPVRLPVAEIGDARGIRAGDGVVAVGFPLPGLLASEANVTTGNVSALAGIGDDARFLQMTVPVQPGNSGGPLLDLQGRVVGVVVGKLDALKVASVTGDIPQNVNFAIKAGILRSFLDASAVGVAPRDRLAEPAYPITLSPASVGADAKAFTVMVECWK